MPESLKPFVTEALWDVREYFRQMGVVLGNEDFLGYDPVAGRVLAATGNSDQLDNIEQLLEPLCSHGPINAEVEWAAARTESPGVATKSIVRLRTHSGAVASAGCTRSGGEELFHSEFETNLGEKAIADLHYEWRFGAPYLLNGEGTTTAVTNNTETILRSVESESAKIQIGLKVSVPEARY